MGKIALKKTSNFLLQCAALTLLLCTGVSAQEKAQSGKIRFRHTVPQLETLPAAGDPITLKVGIDNFRKTDRIMQVLLIRDGKPLLVANDSAYLNEFDLSTYEISIPSPKAELEYQFFLPLASGEVKISKRYRLVRDCLPPTEEYLPQDLTLIPSDEHASILAERATHLEREIHGYENILALIEEIKGIVQ